MPVLGFQNKTFDVDEEGFLRNFSDWCPEWMEHIKAIQGIHTLTDEHWKLIKVLQDYYRENRCSPRVRILSKATGFKMKHIFELFPAGPGKGACKMAGFPKPKGCV
jgi:dissimilatory sulfite reductase related protein